VLKDNDIKISMDGKGAWMDNVFIERLWWSLKYECVYINEFEDVRALRKGLDNWISFYNSKRTSFLAGRPDPDEAYFNKPAKGGLNMITQINLNYAAKLSNKMGTTALTGEC
jgi:putative transposase